jgi:hypothetical protein
MKYFSNNFYFYFWFPPREKQAILNRIFLSSLVFLRLKVCENFGTRKKILKKKNHWSKIWREFPLPQKIAKLFEKNLQEAKIKFKKSKIIPNYFLKNPQIFLGIKNLINYIYKKIYKFFIFKKTHGLAAMCDRFRGLKIKVP